MQAHYANLGNASHSPGFFASKSKHTTYNVAQILNVVYFRMFSCLRASFYILVALNIFTVVRNKEQLCFEVLFSKVIMFALMSVYLIVKLSSSLLSLY